MFYSILSLVRRYLRSRTSFAYATVLVAVAFVYGAGADGSYSAETRAVQPLSRAPRDQAGAPDKRLHEIELVLPSRPDQSAQPMITVDIAGRATVRINTSQRLGVELVDNRAEIRVQYPSGLRLFTTVKSSDTVLQLPDVQMTRVIVRDSYGAAVPGALLDARGGGGRFAWSASAAASAQGIASLPRPANSAGPSMISARAEGFGTHTDEMDFTKSREVTISLEAVGTIVGAITDPTKAIRQVDLRLWEISKGRKQVLQQTVEGAFALKNLAAGEYEFDFIVPRAGVLKVGPVVLGSGQYVDLGSVDVSPNARLTGEVHGSSGKPASGVRVRLSWPGLSGNVMPEAYTDATGHFRFNQLVPGEYYPELFSAPIGWRSFSDQSIVVYGEQSATRSLEFRPSDCSVRIELAGDVERGPVTYSIDLPVTDGSILVKVERGTEERLYPSVPCTGEASVRRMDGYANRYSVSLEPGEAHLVVPLNRGAPSHVRVLVGGQPLSGASLWTTVRNSNEVVMKSRSTNVTDDNGSAMLLLPSSEDLTLYFQRGRLLSVVYQAGLSPRRGSLELDLPNRILRGVARDSNGKAAGGGSFGGNRVPDGDGSGFPVSMVTVFKGVTNADGTFEVMGLAHGKWFVSFSQAATQPPQSYSTEIDLPSSRQEATTLDVKLTPQ